MDTNTTIEVAKALENTDIRSVDRLAKENNATKLTKEQLAILIDNVKKIYEIMEAIQSSNIRNALEEPLARLMGLIQPIDNSETGTPVEGDDCGSLTKVAR